MVSNRVMHFEIPFEDADRARSFYADVFGWNIEPMPELDYTMVSTGPVDEQGMPSEPGYINGGMFTREAPLGSPVITVDVADIDTALDQIEKLGGSTVTARQPVADMGWAAYFKDPEGNLMGLWQSAPRG